MKEISFRKKILVSYNKRDLILYAIGVGSREQRFVYENNEHFSAIPSYITCLSFKRDSSDVVPFMASKKDSVPGLSFDPKMILHGEQEITILKKLPLEGRLTLKSKIHGFYDKGKGALMVTRSSLVDNNGIEYATLESSSFIRGLTGFGGDKGPSNANENEAPKRKADKIFEDKTSENQAEIYRLSGDYNPLHVDPNIATMVGFEKPILHGLCVFGFATRAILASYCDNETSKLKSVKVRFVSPTFPGDTLVTEMWKESNNILFQVTAKKKKKIVVSNAIATINQSNL